MNVDPAPANVIPPELVGRPPYPMVDALREHGEELSVAAAFAVFLALLAASSDKGAGSIVRAAVVAALVGLGVKNLSELDSIIGDTLLPQ
jgi:hypothetical protein